MGSFVVIVFSVTAFPKLSQICVGIPNVKFRILVIENASG